MFSELRAHLEKVSPTAVVVIQSLERQVEVLAAGAKCRLDDHLSGCPTCLAAIAIAINSPGGCGGQEVIDSFREVLKRHHEF